jgi:basic membrane lipoprotein Med (substrate-binding protein (PBP1-ABC) superfamily)
MSMMQACEEYGKARKAAMKQYRAFTSAGSSPYPAVLDEILPNTTIIGEQSLGLVEVPLEMIVGTKTNNRKTAFTRDFLPLLPEKSEFASKWAQLYDAHMEEGIRDPILAYEFMNHFYVQEGNKRVSVLKYVDATSITANVTRILPARSDEKENKLYYEFLAFYELTQMNSIWFSEPGSYLKLLTALGKKPKEPWTDQEKSDLTSLFFHFSTIYRTIGKNNLPLSPSDAFLIYLSIFEYDTLKNKSANELKQSIQKIWKEFIPTDPAESIEHRMDPEETEPTLLQKLIPSTHAKLKIAFLYDKSIRHSSWLFGHELGRLHLLESHPDQVMTTTYENVTPGEMADQVLEEAIQRGNSVIFTTTPTLIQSSLKAAINHPEVKILNCSQNFSYRSIRTYYARVYEAKFLLGLIAGALAPTDLITYEADYPIFGTTSNINAFALGAQMVNPNIKIYLTWSCVKEETPIPKQENSYLISSRNMITPSGPGKHFGLYIQHPDGSIDNLATTILNWGKFYDQIVKSILTGTWKTEESKKKKSLNYWWGISSEMIDIVCSNKIPYGTKKMVDAFRSSICAGIFQPFDGIHYDQQGKPHGKADGQMSHEEIIAMDWLCNNVIGSIPALSDLKDEAKSIVLLQGIQEELT